METTDEKSRVVKHGLEFIKLPADKTEKFFRVPMWRDHPCQLDVFGKEEEVGVNGKKGGR